MNDVEAEAAYFLRFRFHQNMTASTSLTRTHQLDLYTDLPILGLNAKQLLKGNVPQIC